MNSVAKLNKYLVERGVSLPTKKYNERETDRGKVFIMTLSIPDLDIEKTGSGLKKKDAERDACQLIIDLIESRMNMPEVVGGNNSNSYRPTVEKNPISKVQEFAQKYKMASPKYQQMSSTAGPGNHFIISGSHSNSGKRLECTGQGGTKKEAKTNCAVELYKLLSREYLGIEVEDVRKTNSQPRSVPVVMKEEPLVRSYDYKGLGEFQGTSTSSTRPSRTAPLFTPPAPLTLADLPDSADDFTDNMFRHQSDEFPQDLDLLEEYNQCTALIDLVLSYNKVLQLKKMCIISKNGGISYLVFVVIKDTKGTDGYMNFCGRTTLKEAVEGVSSKVIRQLKSLKCGLDGFYTEKLLRNIDLDLNVA